MKEFRRAAPNGDVLTLGVLSSAIGRSRREVYIPLLFLMLEGELALWQDEFFGEVYVGEHPGTPESGLKYGGVTTVNGKALIWFNISSAIFWILSLLMTTWKE